jgi:acetate kinase
MNEMQKVILTFNIGSSSIKFSLFKLPSLQPLFLGHVDMSDANSTIKITDDNQNIVYQEKFQKDDSDQVGGLKYIFDWLKQEKTFTISAIGHRIVHGGEKFSRSVFIDNAVIAQLKELIPLAPVHQPNNIDGIQAAIDNFPSIPQIACFDSAFHLTESSLTRSYALPENISPLPIKHYGFHGLSYQYILQALPSEIASQKNIIAHLGNGASLCATENKLSVATTMGFTALDGLMMGTRCGALDPGIILYLLSTGMTAESITTLLYKKSGLLGVSGISSDMRILLESHESKAAFAVELFVYRAMREIGSLVAALGGLDNMIFTGGIGENSAVIRQKISDKLAWLNIEISAQHNAQHEQLISTLESAVKVWVIATNEEKVMAEEMVLLLNT